MKIRRSPIPEPKKVGLPVLLKKAVCQMVPPTLLPVLKLRSNFESAGVESERTDTRTVSPSPNTQPTGNTPSGEEGSGRRGWNLWEIAVVVLGVVVIAFLLGKAISNNSNTAVSPAPTMVALSTPPTPSTSTPPVQAILSAGAQETLDYLRKYGGVKVLLKDSASGEIVCQLLVKIKNRERVEQFFPEMWETLGPVMKSCMDKVPGVQKFETSNYLVYLYVSDTHQ